MRPLDGTEDVGRRQHLVDAGFALDPVEHRGQKRPCLDDAQVVVQVRFGITPEINALATLLLVGSLTIAGLAFVLPGALRRVRLALRPRRS